jgi:Eukaryotic porin
MSFVSTRSDSSGKLEFSGQYNIGHGISLKSEGFFMDADITKSHVSFELMKEFMDSHISYKFGGGSHNISWMQTLSSRLMAGFEMFYVPHTKEVHFCYGGTYARDMHQFFAQYHPLARKETLTFGYVGRPSKRLTLFTELKGSAEGFSDTTVGFRVRFLEGMLTGTISSSLKATSIYKHYVENIFQL